MKAQTPPCSLVADIGGTNARFRLCSPEGAWCSEVVTLATPSFGDDQALLAQALERLGVATVERALLAVAGPVDNSGNAAITNGGLALDVHRLAETAGGNVRLVNDFFALAAGVPVFESLTRIGGGAAQPGTRAVLGPGTGLGMAALVPGRAGADRWRIVPGEGGHADLAPGNHLEMELWSLLSQSCGHVSWETVLCGDGLVRLYGAMCQVWGAPAEPRDAAAIAAAGREISDPVCHQTLETFCALLGAAAGNLALTVGAVGGVYLGGGIVPRLGDFLAQSPLRRRFEDKGFMHDYVAAIPLLVIGEDQPGLIGARACLEDRVD